MLHNLECKWSCLFIGVAVTSHSLNALVQTCITKGDSGVSAVKQRIDNLTLVQTSKCAVLPKDWSSIGQSTLQAIVTSTKCAVAKLKTLIKDLPEFVHIATSRKSNIRKVDGYNTLVEAAVILRLVWLIVLCASNVVEAITRTVWSQEGTAAHASEGIALAFLLALRKLVLLHLLLRDVVRNKAASGALCSHLSEVVVLGILVNVVLFKNVDELRECRSNPDTLLVLYALVTLTEHLLNDECKVLLLLLILCLVEIHEDGNERSLTVGGHQGDNLVLNGLNATRNLIAKALLNHLVELLSRELNTDGVHLLHNSLADLLTRNVNKRSKVSQGDGLTAVLAGCYLSNDLSCNVACRREAVWTLNQSTGDNSAVLQHVIKVDEVTVVHVLCKVIGIVEVDETLVVSSNNILWKKLTLNEVLRNLTSHVVTLNRNNGRILVGVLLLDFLVVALNQRQNLVIGGVLVTLLVLNVAVNDVLTSNLKAVKSHELILDKVLDLLDGDGVSSLLALIGNVEGSKLNLTLSQALILRDLCVSLSDCVNNLLNLEGDL